MKPKRKSASSGSSFVELFITIPIVLLLTSGVSEFARFYFVSQGVQQVLVEAGRAVQHRCVFPGSDYAHCFKNVIQGDLSKYLEERLPNFKDRGGLSVDLYTRDPHGYPMKGGSMQLGKIGCHWEDGNGVESKTIEEVISKYDPLLVVQLQYNYEPFIPFGPSYQFLKDKSVYNAGLY